MRVFKNYAPKQIAKYVLAFLKVHLPLKALVLSNLIVVE